MAQNTIESSSSSRSLTRPVQQQWWSWWWSSTGPPSPHIISGEAELLKATVRFALFGVGYISEEYARLSQSCQNHLAGPVRKVVCILLLSVFQRCFDDGGLFLVTDASWSACSLPGIPQCAGIYWRTTLHVLASSCICVARRGDLFFWRALCFCSIGGTWKYPDRCINQI